MAQNKTANPFLHGEQPSMNLTLCLLLLLLAGLLEDGGSEVIVVPAEVEVVEYGLFLFPSLLLLLRIFLVADPRREKGEYPPDIVCSPFQTPTNCSLLSLTFGSNNFLLHEGKSSRRQRGKKEEETDLWGHGGSVRFSRVCGPIKLAEIVDLSKFRTFFVAYIALLLESDLSLFTFSFPFLRRLLDD